MTEEPPFFYLPDVDYDLHGRAWKKWVWKQLMAEYGALADGKVNSTLTDYLIARKTAGINLATSGAANRGMASLMSGYLRLRLEADLHQLPDIGQATAMTLPFYMVMAATKGLSLGRILVDVPEALLSRTNIDGGVMKGLTRPRIRTIREWYLHELDANGVDAAEPFTPEILAELLEPQTLKA